VAPEAPRDPEDAHLRLCDQLQVRGELDLILERVAARRKRRIPVEAECRAVDRRLELETDPGTAVRVGNGAADRSAQLDRLRLSPERQRTADRQRVAFATQLVCLEAKLGKALRVEELGREQMAGQVLLLGRDAGDL